MPAAAQAEGEQERPRPDPSPATAPAAAAPSSLIPPVFERSGDEAEDADDAGNLPAAPDEHMGDEQHQQHGQGRAVHLHWIQTTAYHRRDQPNLRRTLIVNRPECITLEQGELAANEIGAW